MSAEQERVETALAEAGAAIMALPTHERRGTVSDYLDRQGLLPAGSPAEDFLVGVFISYHERRVTIEQAYQAGLDDGRREAAS